MVAIYVFDNKIIFYMSNFSKQLHLSYKIASGK